MSNEVAIKVDNITKVYKLYNKPKDRLIETLGFSKKRRSTAQNIPHIRRQLRIIQRA